MLSYGAMSHGFITDDKSSQCITSPLLFPQLRADLRLVLIG